MIKIEIPGSKTLQIEHLVLDFNGTLAEDGMVIDGVLKVLHKLSELVNVHILTADTYGSIMSQLSGLNVSITIAPPEKQDIFKSGYITKLDNSKVACIGNGRNDCLMMKEAALSIAVIQKEGAAFETIVAAQIVCTNIKDALSLMLNPKRLIATLRR